MKDYFQNLYLSAERLNTANIVQALTITGPHANFLDVGCWDGNNTEIWAKAAKAKAVFGIEPVRAAGQKAVKKNIKVLFVKADRERWPLNNSSMDCIVTNQVVEHLSDIDFFLKESSRVLKKNGYLVVSTNNLSSWHNIFALLFGWAPFDLSNASEIKSGLGNPLAIHRYKDNQWGKSWTHKCIYTSKWFSDWCLLYGLKLHSQYGSGYYPLPAGVGNMNKTHCALMTLVFQKNGL